MMRPRLVTGPLSPRGARSRARPDLRLRPPRRGGRRQLSTHDDLGFKNRGACARVFTQAPDGFAETCGGVAFVEEGGASIDAQLLDFQDEDLAIACSLGLFSLDFFERAWTELPWKTLCAPAPARGYWQEGAGLIGCLGPPGQPSPSEPDKDFAPICESNGARSRAVPTSRPGPSPVSASGPCSSTRSSWRTTRWTSGAIAARASDGWRSVTQPSRAARPTPRSVIRHRARPSSCPSTTPRRGIPGAAAGPR
jgi:hypothetical protein